MDALSDTRRMAKDVHKKNVRSRSHGSSWRKRKGGAMGEIEYGKEPKKPQLFTELWAAKHPGGMVYKRDIVHALGNSDQYPFPLWKKDYTHLAEQGAQTETLQAVIAAIDRCPVYEDQQDPDAVSRFSLLTYLMGKMERYGDAYRTADMLLDIQQFRITRRRMDTDG
jgi:hypothetical protein